MKYLLLIIPFILFASDFHTDKTMKTNSAAVIKIFAHTVKPNYYVPWSMKSQRSSTGSGVIIKDNYILTAAHVVSNVTYIEVQKSLDPKKYFAKVKWIAHDADLALLEVEDKSFFKNTTSMKIGDMPKRQDGVAVYGYPVGGTQISITQGIISRIEQTIYSHSRIDLLSLQIDAAINPGNSGGPAFNKEGEIVGIAMQGLLSSNSIGYLVPTPIIRHFLKDITDGKYDGFPDDGIYIQYMENEDLKSHYKMGKRTGVLVTTILNNSSADGYLKAGDVILEIDGYVISDDNSVKTKDLARVHSNYLIRKHYIGEEAHIKIIRDGKVLSLSIPMKSRKSKIPYEQEKKPEYYIFGGFVFMPLTKNYLYAWGKSWRQKAPLEFMYALRHINTSPSSVKELVILQKVLEDKLTAGYRPSNAIITSINGVPINSLQELAEQIEKSTDEVVITTKLNETYILNVDKARGAEKRILEHYGIKNKSYLRE